jgi:alpha-tubulin suppressor-like RCC1 family protein
LGIENGRISISFPTLVEDIRGISELAAGNSHTMALQNTGDVWTFGDNSVIFCFIYFEVWSTRTFESRN